MILPIFLVSIARRSSTEPFLLQRLTSTNMMMPPFTATMSISPLPALKFRARMDQPSPSSRVQTELSPARPKALEEFLSSTQGEREQKSLVLQGSDKIHITGYLKGKKKPGHSRVFLRRIRSSLFGLNFLLGKYEFLDFRLLAHLGADVVELCSSHLASAKHFHILDAG